MRSDDEFEAARGLVRFGLNDCQVARLTGIPRGTIREWRHQNFERLAWRRGETRKSVCPRCNNEIALDRSSYAYLLGLYLGDGCLSQHHRGVFHLRITLDLRYPGIIDECAAAIAAMRPQKKLMPGRAMLVGCVQVNAYWKHWPCLFPQHGAGPKHTRPIKVEPWQQEIVDAHPGPLLRGLVHADGSRDLNVVNGKSYPRYSFSNNSADIQEIFCRACERLGVHWTRPYWKTIAISRRPDVEKLDRIIGPKK
jgi:hypothetical protein